jgi:hypothetical protein
MNSYGALFRLLHLDYLIGLRGEIQRRQYFMIRHLKLLGRLISIVSIRLLRKTAHHSE